MGEAGHDGNGNVTLISGSANLNGAVGSSAASAVASQGSAGTAAHLGGGITSLTYGVFNLPASMSRSVPAGADASGTPTAAFNVTATYRYGTGGGGGRVRMLEQNGAPASVLDPLKQSAFTETLYIGAGFFERERKANALTDLQNADGSINTGASTNGSITTKWKHYIHTPEGAIAVVVISQEANQGNLGTDPASPLPESTKYWFKDHLGSITAETEEGGANPQFFAFDVWGTRLNLNGTQAGSNGANADTATHRGFTGHEHLFSFGLIHMNGRLYDPEIGRFLQADPVISNPYDSQAYNRYTYVKNNPLMYTDPTGYRYAPSGWVRFREEWVQPIITVVAWATCYAYAVTCGYAAAITTAQAAYNFMNALASGNYVAAGLAVVSALVPGASIYISVASMAYQCAQAADSGGSCWRAIRASVLSFVAGQLNEKYNSNWQAMINDRSTTANAGGTGMAKNDMLGWSDSGSRTKDLSNAEFSKPAIFSDTTLDDGTTRFIGVPMKFSGSGATGENIDSLIEFISKKWSGFYLEGEKIMQLVVRVFVFNGENSNAMILGDGSENPIYENSSRSVWRCILCRGGFVETALQGLRSALESAAHEVGHMFGLDDKYNDLYSHSDGLMSMYKIPFVSQSIPKTNYEQNIMGAAGGEVTGRDRSCIGKIGCN